MKTVKYWNAILLAIIGGVIGLQEFYLGCNILGILAVLFFWTGIPAVVAYIEAAIWLFNDEDNKFNKKVYKPLNS